MKKFKKIIADHTDEITIGIIILGIVLFIFITFQLELQQRTVLNLISVMGTMVSTFGFTIALMQIIAFKELSEVTQTTITETKIKLILGISISVVTEAIKLVSEIDSFIGNRKYEIARHKIIDLREKLIQSKTSDEFKLIVKENKIKSILSVLNVQINTLYKLIFSEIEIKYDPESINHEQLYKWI
ncbi:MAG: hypothetical protein M3Q95_08515 [Bacteroidota bacterium]|nr:hypothetical protein [Bacteroidota bacterium]